MEDLGGLGLSGICGELHRVVFRSIIGYSVDAAFPSALLLAHVATLRGLCSLVEADHIGAWWVTLFLLEGDWMIVLPLLSRVWTAIYVFRVAALYCTQGDFRASFQRHLPHLPFTRFIPTYLLALALTSATFFLSLAALLLLHDYKVGLPLQLLAAAAFLAGTAYVAVVCHLACVVPMLEDSVQFAALRKSRALLAGKFWPSTRTPAGYEAAAATCHQSIFRAVLLHLPCQVSLPSTPPRRQTTSSSCASPSSHIELRICTAPRRRDPAPSMCRMKHRSTKDVVRWSHEAECTSKNAAPKR
uniref:Uncharacterized protein n=1 Tax=Aegilops tauschii TaxID=37682 RepID=M8BRL1_AEGTA